MRVSTVCPLTKKIDVKHARKEGTMQAFTSRLLQTYEGYKQCVSFCNFRNLWERQALNNDQEYGTGN